MNFRKISIMLLVFIFLTIPVLANGVNDTEQIEEPEQRVAAVVNGEEITVQELDLYLDLNNLVNQVFQAFYQSNRDFVEFLLMSEAGQDFFNEYRKEHIEEVISNMLIQQEAANRGIEISDEEKDELFAGQIEYMKSQNRLESDQELENALKQDGFENLQEFKDFFFAEYTDILKINELQRILLEPITVSNEEAEGFYNEYIEQFQYGDQVKASHILLKTEEEAEKVLDELNEGTNFALMAEEHSIDTYSAQNGGDLDFSEKEDMIEEFSEAAFAMEIGEISDIVETREGFHIIMVTDKREAGTETLEEVREEIENGLLKSKRQLVWQGFVLDLREKADVEIKL